MTVHVQMDVPTEPRALQAAVEGLAALNAELMRQGNGVQGLRSQYPPLYSSGVVYRREAPGCEDWQNADRLLAAGEGDCEDLAAYRVGELRATGELGAHVLVVPTGPGMYHAIVGRANGETEDPSRILINMESNMKPKLTLKRLGGHHIASLELPLLNGDKVRASELGFDPFGALSKVLSTVMDVVSSPVVSALLPPQAAAAITAVKMISNMSINALEKLLDDDRTSDAQRKIAQKVLEAKKDADSSETVGAAVVVDHRGTKPGTATGITASGQWINPNGINSNLPPAAPPGTYTAANRSSASGAVQPTAGVIDPMTGLMWTGQNWARPGANAQAPAAPSDPYNPTNPYAPVDPSQYQNPYQAPYQNPYQYQGYPSPGYPYPPPGGYAPPGYPPMMPQMPYPMMPMAQMPYGGMYPQYGYQQQYPQYPAGFDPSQAMVQPQPLSADEAAAITLWGSGSFAPGAFPGYDQGSGQMMTG